MANIFVSYCRESQDFVKSLAEDIEELGHEVWYDHGLSGGQAWWDQILENIRNCDIFVTVLVPEVLDSTACTREYGYAADIGKPILPIMAGDGVSDNLLPPALSKIQYVDYRQQDKSSALRLGRAITLIPPPGPLPDPLPEPPEVPISYLGGLTEQIDSTDTLSYEKQSALVFDLKRGLRDPETTADARKLLTRLRNRRDLLASIADEIDELLKKKRMSSDIDPESQLKNGTTLLPGEQRDKPLKSKSDSTIAGKIPITLGERLRCALSGAILGIIVGILAMQTYTESSLYGLITGIGWGIAGAITGKNNRRIVAASIGAVICWIIVSLIFLDEGPFAAGGVFGAPPGAIIGAIIGAKLQKRK